VRIFGCFDEGDDGCLVAHIDARSDATDVVGDTFRFGTVEVDNHDLAGALGMGGSGDRFADSRPATGDYDDSIVQFHRVTVPDRSPSDRMQQNQMTLRASE
jgi:hypothetical protein